ncbi:hypothetical protein BDB01DRAFT_804048 [Pilobolus umbonatus]|nr:hypothetical protein BDB01DRAFT_804048 [Pilobolus umbonatus]
MKAACYLSILLFFFTISAFAGQVVAKQKAKIKDKMAVNEAEKRAILIKKCGEKCKPLKFTLNARNKCICAKLHIY